MAKPPLPTPPASLADFKKRYRRDFKFGKGHESVMDSDIENAMQDAMNVFNPNLFSDAEGWQGFLYLTAHFVRINIEGAGGLGPEGEGLGIENQGEQVLSSASTQGVSRSHVEPPDYVKRVPLFLQLWVTTYGQKYVAMAQPKLVGNVGIVAGPRDFNTEGQPDVPFTDQ